MKELSNLKLYNNKNNGGISPCIDGNRSKLSLDKKYNVLPNCVGWSVARFNEFAGRDTCKYLMSRNPDVIWGLVEGQGLKRGSEPRLGAAAIYQGSGSSHILNVERCNKDGSIYVSESGWNAKSYYWHSTLSGSNFNQGESWLSSYKLLGFVYQPLLKQMYVNAKAGLNLRTEPSTNCTILTTTPYKTKVNIYAIQDGWAASEKGWYSMDYLQDDPIADEPLINQNKEVKEEIKIEDDIKNISNDDTNEFIESVKEDIRKDDNMTRVKTVSKYVVNILTIANALLLAVNSVEGISIPYTQQISGVIIGICSVLSTYLLGQKAIKKEE